MKKAKILLSFTKLSDANLDVKANAILVAMTGNTYFPDPQPSLEVLGTAIQNFSEALSASQTKHKVSVVAKRNMRSALVQVLYDLADFLSYNAKGDRLALVSTGFDVSVEFKSAKLLGEPSNFTVLPGKNSGEVMLKVSGVTNGVTYIYFYALTPVVNNAWQHMPGDGPSLVLSGLDSVKEYSFRVGIGSYRGQMVYTNIITRMVV